MNFPTITIPDPASVGKWLDEQQPTPMGWHDAMFTKSGWSTLHWPSVAPGYISAQGDTPEALLADIRRQIADNDPLEKLRKEWIAAGRPDLNDQSPDAGATE